MTYDDRLAQLVRDFADSPDNRCFVCGPGNPSGLRLRFEAHRGVARARFVPGELHQGWEHVVHGGILASVLDEAMAYSLFFLGLKAVTARLDVRYRHPARAGDVLTVEAEVVRDGRRMVDVQSRVLHMDYVIAEASGRFFKVGALSSLSLSGTGLSGDD